MRRQPRALHNAAGEKISTQWETRLTDLLSPPARAERRLLLLMSTITLVAVSLGLFPTKVEALGITFESKDRAMMVWLLGGITLYAWAGFALYAVADWRLMLRGQYASTSVYIDEFIPGKATAIESLNFYLRILFDFAFPLLFGAYALYRAWLALMEGGF